MRYLFTLGHPAHYHFYKHIVDGLLKREHEIKIIISNKDILRHLLDEDTLSYTVLSTPKKNESRFQKAKRLLSSCVALLKIVIRFKPDLMIGCLTQMGVAGFLTRTPSIFNGEDDFSYTFLQGIITYPFIKHIVTPSKTNVSFFRYKQIRYHGFQKLAYLHPRRFIPDRGKVSLTGKSPFFVLRFSSLAAYHDLNAAGLNNAIASRLIKLLEPHGRILISSERDLPEQFEKYRFRGNLNDMHHYLYFADLYVGDSQSMAVEAAILGTPGIRFNNFVKKISVLEELESKYKLAVGIHSSQPEKLFERIETLLKVKGVDFLSARRTKLLSDKIDVSAFMIWFLDNYPGSVEKMKQTPEIQFRFR